jgi:hypothetical protein
MGKSPEVEHVVPKESVVEFDPLEGVKHHWGQAQEQFKIFLEQFQNPEHARNFIGFGYGSRAFDHGQTVRECIQNLTEKAAKNPDDLALTSLSGVMSNLIACAGFSSAIDNLIPGYPGNHYGYDNYYASMRKVASTLVAVDRTVYSLGLGPEETSAEESPFQKLAALV